MQFFIIVPQKIIRKMQKDLSYQNFPSPQVTVNMIKFPL